MNSVINTKFIMPMNIGDEICQFLKNRSLLIDDFHILSFITKKNIITLSIEFNSLDSKSFEKVLNFINQNSELCKCDISFFPKEEFGAVTKKGVPIPQPQLQPLVICNDVWIGDSVSIPFSLSLCLLIYCMSNIISSVYMNIINGYNIDIDIL